VLPDAELWTAPNTGHGINLEQPVVFNSQLENFLAAVESRIRRGGSSEAESCPVVQLQRRVPTARVSQSDFDASSLESKSIGRV
jgi:hypothetical protein